MGLLAAIDLQASRRRCSNSEVLRCDRRLALQALDLADATVAVSDHQGLKDMGKFRKRRSHRRPLPARTRSPWPTSSFRGVSMSFQSVTSSEA
jgi:hypothetical protein